VCDGPANGGEVYTCLESVDEWVTTSIRRLSGSSLTRRFRRRFVYWYLIIFSKSFRFNFEEYLLFFYLKNNVYSRSLHLKKLIDPNTFIIMLVIVHAAVVSISSVTMVSSATARIGYNVFSPCPIFPFIYIV